MTDKLKKLQSDYKFIIEPGQQGIWHFIFEDGRQYKFQKPTFMNTYGRIMNSENAPLEILKLGLENLYPENDKSPKIDDDYLNTHSEEGWGIWSTLFRELL